MSCDVAIVGAGPDGLVAAALLARAGASVIVLERRFERAGSLVSDDYSTPFTFTLRRPLLPAAAVEIADELGLRDHGLVWTEPRPLHGDDEIARRYAQISGVPDDAVLIAGGSKNLANALFRAAAVAGARCEVTAEVAGIEVTGSGYRLTTFDGRTTDARQVVWTPTSAVEERPRLVAHLGVKGALDVTRPVVEPFGFEAPDDVDAADGRTLCGHFTVVTVFDPLQASPGPYGPLHTIRVEVLASASPPGGWMRARRAFRQRVYDAIAPRLGDAILLQQFCDTPDDVVARFAPRMIDLPAGVHVVEPDQPGSLRGGRRVAAALTA